MATDQKQRQFDRFDTDVRISFRTPYDFRSEVDFRVEREKQRDDHTYVGFSRNISLEGVCFESSKQLKSGDFVWIELHLPKSHETVYMEGEVRWCHVMTMTGNAPKQFLTGVHVNKVDGKEVKDTVYFDEKYKVQWSELLERVLGNFAKLCRTKQSSSGKGKDGI